MRSEMKGLLVSIFGTSLVIGSLLIMNQPQTLSKKNKSSVVRFDDVIQKSKAKNKIVREIKKKEKPKVQPAPMSAQLMGNSFGLKSFEGLGDLSSGLLGDLSNVAMNEETVDVAPVPVEQGILQYPDRARELGLEGHVMLSMLVNQFGVVEKIKLLTATPEGAFENAALEAARGWRFRPGSFKGKTVKAWVKQKIVFSLN